jgi:hypothetical protein
MVNSLGWDRGGTEIFVPEFCLVYLENNFADFVDEVTNFSCNQDLLFLLIGVYF